jgi:CheY-like chemotaxis protein
MVLNLQFEIVTTGKEEKELMLFKNIAHRKKHILCVDDDHLVAEYLKGLLEHSGYQVTAMTSSQEALKVFREQHDRIDLVISDMYMPEMSGAELALKLKYLRPGIPILLCTGCSRDADAKNHENLFCERLLKPIYQETLLGAIQRALKQ